jgi:hypothetical protein
MVVDERIPCSCFLGLHNTAREQLINEPSNAVYGYQATVNLSCGGFIDMNCNILIENIR